jgi:hypothetical protein
MWKNVITVKYKQQLHIVHTSKSSNNVWHLSTKTITTLQHSATLHHTSPKYTSLHFLTLHTSPNYISLHFATLHPTTLHYTLPHFTTIDPTTLCYTSPHFTQLHFTTLTYTSHFTHLHFAALHHTSPNYTSLHFTTLHPTSLHYTSLHFTQLHFTTLIDISLPLIYTSPPFQLALITYIPCGLQFSRPDSLRVCASSLYSYKNPASQPAS